MARSREVSLSGPAAKAFLGLKGFEPAKAKTDDEALMEVATAIYLNMKVKDHKGAVEVLKRFRDDCKKDKG